MAKSLFDTYVDGTMEVTHNGEEALFDLPTWMCEAGSILEDKEKLLEWMEKHDNTLAIIHSGLAKTKIDFCAVVRPADIPGDLKGEKIKVSLIKDIDNAQKRADDFTIKPATRSGTGGSTKTKAEIETLTKVIQAMHDAGIDDETIKTMQVPVFGNIKVALALNNINR
jgi:hypothetical protein